MKICIIKVDFHKIAFIKLNEKSILWAPGNNRCLSKSAQTPKITPITVILPAVL